MSQRGVSLVEALVALAVMAFGLLGVVGMQVTLRANSDVAKQRSEAVRIAQATVEDWRAFEQLTGAGGVADFDADVADQAPASVPGLTNANTTFVRSAVVMPAAMAASAPRLKTVTMSVTWQDRNDQPSSVSLVSSIAGIAPELAGSLGLPGDRAATQNPRGRKGWVPPGAKNLPGTGTSVFMPPQATGGTVAWVFNNTTGLLTGVCTLAAGSTTSSIVAADVAACSNNTSGQLLSGYVRFADLTVIPLMAGNAENPMGLPRDLYMTLVLNSTIAHPRSPDCFDDSEAVALTPTPGAAVTYFCVIYNNVANKWAGRLDIAPLGGWTIGTAAGNFKVCRYTTLATDVGNGTDNAEHPASYVEPPGATKSTSLTNQNFLVISSAQSCPTDTPTAGDFVNSNTRLHQP